MDLHRSERRGWRSEDWIEKLRKRKWPAGADPAVPQSFNQVHPTLLVLKELEVFTFTSNLSPWQLSPHEVPTQVFGSLRGSLDRTNFKLGV